jgi:glycosyltransferase involved in cell wall biosynthesis
MINDFNQTPLVSIIVPVFEGERYLRASLDSILAQTYRHMEVLVMDDASKDSTAEIIASYGGRVRSFRQPVNRGIYGNMNDGIAMAHGALIAIYHSDDLYGPTIVERQVNWLQLHPEAGTVFCKDIFIDPQGRERGRLVLPPEVQGNGLLDYQTILNALLTYKNRFLRCPSCMVRAAVYRDVGVYRDQEFKNTSDLEMYLRIARKYPVGILDEFLFSYRWGHGNSGQRYKILRTDAERFFTIMDIYLSFGGKALAKHASLAAYEAHRAEDNLMRVVNHYILDKRREAVPILRQIQVRRLLGSRRIQRWRLLLLFAALQALIRAPRIPFVANLFRRRWHASSFPPAPAKPPPALQTGS